MSSLVKGCRIRSLWPHFNITLTITVLVTDIKEFKIKISLQSPNLVCLLSKLTTFKAGIIYNGIWPYGKERGS